VAGRRRCQPAYQPVSASTVMSSAQYPAAMADGGLPIPISNHVPGTTGCQAQLPNAVPTISSEAVATNAPTYTRRRSCGPASRHTSRMGRSIAPATSGRSASRSPPAAQAVTAPAATHGARGEPNDRSAARRSASR